MATGVLFSVWARASGLGTAVCTGYILWLGGTRTDIAFLTSLAYLASLVQVISVRFTSRARNKKRLVFVAGSIEIAFRFLIIAIPFFFARDSSGILALYILVAIGLCFGYLVSPIFNDWMAKTIPVNLRARYTSQRTIWSTVFGIVAGYLFGEFLDHYAQMPEPSQQYAGFAWLFVVGLLAGIGGYLFILRAPLPEMPQEEGGGVLEALGEIFRSRPFVLLFAFTILQQIAMGISMPFYVVYMLEELKLSYATIAVYSNLALVATIVCYKAFGTLVDRFGSKPVLQIILVPGALGQFLRVFTSPDFPHLMPISMALYASYHAAMLVALTPLFYGMLPKEGNRPAYFAAWSASVCLFGAIAPLIGNSLAGRFEGFQQVWFGFPIGNLQLVFVCTTVGLLALAPLVWRLEEKRAQTAGSLIVQVSKGNPISYIYNTLSMSYLGGESSRVRATTSLALSGSPLAGDSLVRGLEDLSPEVRKKAAEGLGMIGADEAVSPLIGQLADSESDIRAEAAEALGKIGHPLGLDAIRGALDDQNPAVRISAIRGLGDIGGEGVSKLLFERLTSTEFDRPTFPTLVDVLSKLGNKGVVPIALQNLRNLRSPILRAQVLNSVCRAIGAEESFYQLATLDELKQATKTGTALQRAQKRLGDIKSAMPAVEDEALHHLTEARTDFDRGDMVGAFRELAAVAESLWELIPPGLELSHRRGARPDPQLSPKEQRKGSPRRPTEAAQAIVQFSATCPREEIGQQEILFASVCVCTCIAQLKMAVTGGKRGDGGG